MLNLRMARTSDHQVVNSSIFDEHWWFDAACPGAWDVKEIYRDNYLVASFAFHTFKKMGFRHIQMPKLTRTLEPQIFAPGAKAVSRLQNQASILSDLVDALPNFDRFEICLPPESELGLPFALNGFRTTTMFTYRYVEDANANPWHDMEQKTRNTVASAQKHFQVESHFDLARFVRFSKVCRSLPQQDDQTDYAAVERLFEACQQRGQTTILSAINQADQDVASAILVWDDRTLYFWISVRMSGSSGNGANSLLVWEAHKFARKIGRELDLDGFATRQSGIFLAKFGFKPTPRTYITNVNPFWSGLQGMRGMFKPVTDAIAYR